jgi:hypothetical protein
MLVDPKSAVPRCTCVVDLISKVMRPYLFRAVVTGEYPHAFREAYTIVADSDASAAMKAMELFCDKYGRQMPAGVVSVVPRAKLA